MCTHIHLFLCTCVKFALTSIIFYNLSLSPYPNQNLNLIHTLPLNLTPDPKMGFSIMWTWPISTSKCPHKHSIMSKNVHTPRQRHISAHTQMHRQKYLPLTFSDRKKKSHRFSKLSQWISCLKSVLKLLILARLCFF